MSHVKKRKHDEEDEFGSDDNLGQSRGYSSRVRKKSAKVIEMEEAEELEKLERKQWKKDQKSAAKKSKTIKSTLMRSPGAGSPASKSLVKTESLMIDDVDIKEEASMSPQEPITMKLQLGGTVEKSSKKKSKKPPESVVPPLLESEIKTEGEGPLMMKFVMSSGKEMKVEETVGIKTEGGRKKKGESNSPKKKKSKAAAMATAPAAPPTLSPELLAHLSAAQEPPLSSVLDPPKKEKKAKAMTMPTLQTEEPEIKSEDEDEDDEMGEEEEEEDDEPIHYVNTAQMAQKVLTSSEKKAGKGKKKEKKEGSDKPKKKRGPTAYMLWCNSRRPKLVEDNPGIDFSTISKRLGEIWQSIPEKEKMSWKRKAKKMATKGSSMITTGKAKAASNLLNKGGNHQVVAGVVIPGVSGVMGTGRQGQLVAGRGLTGVSRQQIIEEVSGVSFRTNAKVTPLDAAAHLKLLGESLSIIGARLQEHQGKIAVQGSFSVLLDSLICALGPLVALTNQVPELDGASSSTHNSTLDNIAYVMPGIV